MDSNYAVVLCVVWNLRKMQKKKQKKTEISEIKFIVGLKFSMITRKLLLFWCFNSENKLIRVAKRETGNRFKAGPINFWHSNGVLWMITLAMRMSLFYFFPFWIQKALEVFPSGTEMSYILGMVCFTHSHIVSDNFQFTFPSNPYTD